jgi:ABC-type branched-subunit amino acid transport system substrate-binding protein
MTRIAPTLRRRTLLAGLGALVVSRTGAALACHERDHPPCHAAALVSLTGPSAPALQQAAAGIRAMNEHLQQTDAQRRGHLGILIIDSAGRPDIAADELRRLVTSGMPPAAVIVADPLPPPLLERIAADLKTPMISILSFPADASSQWVCRLSPNAIQIADAIMRHLGTLPGQRGRPVNILSAPGSDARVAQFAVVLQNAGKPINVRVSVTDPFTPDLSRLEPEIGKADKNSAWIVSAPLSVLPALIAVIRRAAPEGPIIIDTGIADPGPVLRAAASANVVAISPFAPDLVERRPLATAIARRVREATGSELTAPGAVAATAVQVLVEAVVAADVRGDNYGEAVRNSLRNVSLPGRDLILPWDGVSFDDAFQNRSARAVALGLRDNRLVTVSPT